MTTSKYLGILLVVAVSVTVSGWTWMRPVQPRPMRQIVIPKDTQLLVAERAAGRGERLERLREMQLNRESLREFVGRYRGITRDALVTGGFLRPTAPQKGTSLIGAADRTAEGEALLREAKDVLYGLLFGDEGSGTRFRRVERELLTLTVPRGKVLSLEFMQAATELAAAGTWQDPESVSNDERAENVIIEVEYGEIREEGIGDGIVACLRLINALEVNEQILYARMINVEQSTLVD